MCNAIGISMNTSQVSVIVCLKNDLFYHNIEDIHPTLSTWVHIDVSVLHYFNKYILLKGTFVDYFSPIIMKNKPVNF